MIQKMEENMIGECVEIYINTFTREPWFDVIDDKQKVVNYFSNHLKNNYTKSYVYLDEGKIIGFCVSYLKPWIEGMELYIDEICINYGKQHQGFGSHFLKQIILDLQQAGINNIILNTSKHTDAYNFYKKFGFKEIENLVVLVR